MNLYKRTIFLFDEKTIRPSIAEIDEPINIHSFELLTMEVSSNARLDMNIDIVKPIPPSRPTPAKFFQVNSVCNLAIPIRTKV